jgi:hypothetical protein
VGEWEEKVEEDWERKEGGVPLHLVANPVRADAV